MHALARAGSTLYQLTVQDCNDKDSSYLGTWYCGTMEVCESFINSNRVCIVTKGCATESECTSTSSTIYDSSAIQTTSGIAPAGMTITASCCEAEYYENDDTVAVDYSKICNAGTGSPLTGALGLALMLVASTMYMLTIAA
jgi:hypothetical protein